MCIVNIIDFSPKNNFIILQVQHIAVANSNSIQDHGWVKYKPNI